MNADELTRQVEGKPAPMPLLAVQAFANTLDVETSTDLLSDRAAFLDWMKRSGVAEPGIEVSAADLRLARKFRGVIRDLLAANERGVADKKAGASLAKLTAERRVQLTADPATGQLTADTSPATGVSDLVCLLLGIVLLAQANDEWGRLKLCENAECQWAFYDNSRNRSGSWCRMGQCGNRLKNRAYRERQRSS